MMSAQGGHDRGVAGPAKSPVFRRGPLPLHLLLDHHGYRTPTNQDIESIAGAYRTRLLRQDAQSYALSASALRSAILSTPAENTYEATPLEKTSDLNFVKRLRHFTWSFFTLTMATGGIANVIDAVPFRFPGLYAIGCFFFLLNIIFFISNFIMITTRFILYPGTLRDSFIHPSESLFVGASIVSFGTILLNISQYGVQHTGLWLNNTVLAFFWLYCGLAIVGSVGIYLVMWSTQMFTVAKMTPVWIFPAYPLLIIAPHAGVLSKTLSQQRSFDVIIGGLTLQGTGFMVSLMIYSAFIYRLMTHKLPQEALRPGMFVSVGPAAFTVSGILSIGRNLHRSLPDDFLGDGPNAAFVLELISLVFGVWLWGLAVWFFLASVGAHYSCVRRGTMMFSMSWFSFIFPQTALVTATFAIAEALSSRGIAVVGCVMACILVVAWAVIVFLMFRAVYLRHLLWPEQGEDREEGGFRRGSI